MDEILDRMEAALGECPLVANVTESLAECATYDQYTTAYDGIKRAVTMKVRIFAATMARALELESALDHALVTPGDLPLTNTCLRCRRNGGGWINDGDRHCRIAYYELLIKDENLGGIDNG